MFSQNRWAEQKSYSVRPPQVQNENSSMLGFRDDAGSVVRDAAAAMPEAGRLAEVRASTQFIVTVRRVAIAGSSHHIAIWSVYGEICGVVLGCGAPSGSLSTGSFSSWTARRVPIQKGSTTWSLRGFAVLG